MSISPIIQAGYGTTLRETASGFAANARVRQIKWRHPWAVTPVFHASTQIWSATIRAGYVNGKPPIFRTTMREQKPLRPDHGTNPLTGKPYFSDPIFNNGREVPVEDRVLDIPLYLAPQIPLDRWRAVGADGTSVEAVPPELLARGVQPVTGDTTRPQRRARHLRAIDLILHQPRLGVTARVVEDEGLLTGVSFAQQRLETVAPAADDVLRVYAGNFRAQAPLDPSSGIFEEPAWDELKIATLYMLSPVGLPSTAEPDNRWTPYLKHEIFWNLRWLPARQFRPPGGDNNIPFNPGLVGGLAQPIVNALTAAQNDLLQEAFNRIADSSQAGTWWTPTGGGHESYLPPELPFRRGAAPALSKTGQRALRRQTAAESLLAQVSEGLDPQFPFRAIGFNPERLS